MRNVEVANGLLPMAEAAYSTNATSTLAPSQPPSAKFPLSRRSFFGSLFAALATPFIAKSAEVSEGKLVSSFTLNPDSKFTYAIVNLPKPTVCGTGFMHGDEVMTLVDVYVLTEKMDSQYAKIIRVYHGSNGSVFNECSCDTPLREALQQADFEGKSLTRPRKAFSGGDE